MFFVIEHINLSYSSLLWTSIFAYVIDVIIYLEFLCGTHDDQYLKNDDSGSKVGNIFNLLLEFIFSLFSSFKILEPSDEME